MPSQPSPIAFMVWIQNSVGLRSSEEQELSGILSAMFGVRVEGNYEWNSGSTVRADKLALYAPVTRTQAARIAQAALVYYRMAAALDPRRQIRAGTVDATVLPPMEYPEWFQPIAEVTP